MSRGADANAYRIDVLGPFRLSRDHRLISVRPGEQRLVALLAVDSAASRSDAADTLWPDVRRDRAQANLRTVLSRLRIQAAELVHEDGKVLHLADAVVDLAEVREWASAVVDFEARDVVSPPLGLFGKQLLPSWDEPWLNEARDEFDMLKLYALESAAHRLVAQGKLVLASSYASAAVRIDPLRESAARILIDIYMRQGNTAAALREYQRISRFVLEATGTQPTSGLTSLVASMGLLNFAAPSR